MPMTMERAHITILLDRSHSMSLIRDATIAGFNDFLDEQRPVHGDATVTLYQFNQHCELRFEGLPINSVRRLSRAGYKPAGGTALVQCMCNAIDCTAEYLRKMEAPWPTHVFFVTLTDGEQNTWAGQTLDDLVRRIREKKTRYHWHFTYLAANQDAIETASKLSIDPDASLTFAHHPVGVRMAYRAAASQLVDVRVGIKQRIRYTEPERQAACGL